MELIHCRKLSDIDEDGHLTFMEFTIAMHLLFIAKLGYFLPVDLDPNTILPPSVSVYINRRRPCPSSWARLNEMPLGHIV